MTTEDDNRTYSFTLDRHEMHLLIPYVGYVVKHTNPNDPNLMGDLLKASGTALLKKLIDQSGLIPPGGSDCASQLLK